MNSTEKTARIAGLWYLLLAITAPLGLIYVPRTLIVPGNATATASNILASEPLFRLGMASELISATVFIFLVLALYHLLKGVNERHAGLMVALAVVSVPISFLNVLNEIAAVILFRGADLLSVFEKRQLDALGMVFLGLHHHGFVVAAIFWGLWLLPFGVLVIRSGFFPRILGVLLIINGFAYLVGSFTSLLLPGYTSVVSRFTLLPEAVGELSMILWLLIKGAKVQPFVDPAS
jgi:Domain of unknown function (DUF4386)